MLPPISAVIGSRLALHNYAKPYDQRECGLADMAETFALTSRRALKLTVTPQVRRYCDSSFTHLAVQFWLYGTTVFKGI